MRTFSTVLLACSLAAQAQLRVPQQFSEIAAAIRAARPGDEIWVTTRPGGYAPIVIDKPLTILGVGSESETPIIFGTTGPAIDVRLATDELVIIGRIDAYSPSATAAPAVTILGGRVIFEDAELRQIIAGAPANALTVSDADLVLLRSRVESSAGAGLCARNSHVVALHAWFFAGNSSLAPAIDLVNSTLHGSEVFGSGSEGVTQVAGAPALAVDAQSRAWLTHSMLRGGFGMPGAPALANQASAPAEFMECQLAGGFNLSGGGSAPPSSGAVNLAAPLLGAAQPPALYRTFGSLHLGGGTGFTLRASTGTPALLLWSDSLVRVYNHPLLAQPTRMPTTAGVLVVGGGTFSVVVNVPNVTALLGRALWIHGVAGTALPLAVAPLMGGVVRA